MTKRPTRLDLHRFKFHKDGEKGALLSLKDLSTEEMAILSTEIFSQMQKRDPEKTDMYEVYTGVLADWGVMCPHPQHKRLYEGKVESPVPKLNFKWYRCLACGCEVVNGFVTAEGKGEQEAQRGR